MRTKTRTKLAPLVLLSFFFSLPLVSYSLYFTVISPYATSTYKLQSRTENLCVAGSIPALPIHPDTIGIHWAKRVTVTN